MPEIVETTVQADGLQPGDYLMDTCIGGHAGEITAVRCYPDKVRVDFAAGVGVYLSPWEVCTVRRVVEERPRMATIHPLFAGVLSAHGVTR